MIVGNKVDLSEESDMRAVKTEDGECLAIVSTPWDPCGVNEITRWLSEVSFKSHTSMRKTQL